MVKTWPSSINRSKASLQPCAHQHPLVIEEDFATYLIVSAPPPMSRAIAPTNTPSFCRGWFIMNSTIRRWIAGKWT